MFYVVLTLSIIGAIAAAWAIQTYIIDPEMCDREEHGWRCRGKDCEGCYRVLPDDTREYKNDWPHRRENEAKKSWQ